MLHRTYFARLSALMLQNLPNLDIMVEGPVGSQAAPVASIASWPGAVVTTPPAAWVAACGTGAFYEIRSRTLRIEKRSTATGFVPFTNLGFAVSISQYNDDNTVPAGLTPGFALSASLRGTPADAAGVIPGAALADPPYGPIIRLYNDAQFHPEGGVAPIFVVNLFIAERKDEDFSHIGGP